MKLKLFLLITTATASSILTSCSYTDLSPLDSFTDESYWNTPSDLKLYANGLYGIISSPTATGDSQSDNFVSTNYNSFLFDEYLVPTQASSGSGWYWNDIRSCNYFLQRYKKAVGSEAEINKYVGEVRFFRSILYFSKIRMFGDVPWYDKDLNTSDTNELYKARDSRDMVLAKIIEDLEFAIENLPASGDEEKGRINKDAARTQLARVCLYYGTYKKYHKDNGTISSTELLTKAAALTNDIMQSGRYEIVKGTDAGAAQSAYEGYPLYYSNQFIQEDLSGNKEAILCRYYTVGVLTHGIGRTAGGGGVGLTKDFVESFLMKDGTPIYNQNSNYQGDEDQNVEFANRDPRIYQIIDNEKKPYTVQNGERESHVGNVNSNEGVTGYNCVKFRSPNTQQSEANNTFYDWFVYRYAEVLLIHAEAKAELDQCDQSVLDKTINLLRDRVEMAHLTANPVADAKPINYGYTLSNLLYEIRRERRIELIAENHRMDDLVRWNAMKLLENPKTMLGLKITPTIIETYQKQNVTFGGEGGRPVTQFDGSTYLYQYASSKALDDAGRKWSATDRRWLYPLPTNELTLNKNLVQNPGWE